MSRKRSARETELEIETLRLKQRIEDLEQVIKQQSEGLTSKRYSSCVIYFENLRLTCWMGVGLVLNVGMMLDL